MEFYLQDIFYLVEQQFVLLVLLVQKIFVDVFHLVFWVQLLVLVTVNVLVVNYLLIILIQVLQLPVQQILQN